MRMMFKNYKIERAGRLNFYQTRIRSLSTLASDWLTNSCFVDFDVTLADEGGLNVFADVGVVERLATAGLQLGVREPVKNYLADFVR